MANRREVNLGMLSTAAAAATMRATKTFAQAPQAIVLPAACNASREAADAGAASPAIDP